MEVTRLFDIFAYQLENSPQKEALNFKVNNQWIHYSTQDMVNNANFVTLGLIELGLVKNDKVGIISPNRPEWNFCDIGSLQLGCVNVPIYPTATSTDYKYILNHAEVKVLFVDSMEQYTKVQEIRKEVPSLFEVISFQKIEGVTYFWDFIKKQEGKKTDVIKSYSDIIKPDEVATMVYTSGTTGFPKGVMLTHNNILSNIVGVEPRLPFDKNSVCLSFLPLCHIFERVVVFVYFYSGTSIFYAESLEKIADNLKEVKPHFFSTVPRLLEKVYDKIVLTGTGLSGIKRKLFFWALDLGLRYEINGKNGWWYEFQLKIARKLIFSKWKAALGGNVIGIVSGASALQERLARVFWGAGIPVMEGYGMTELSPVVSVNCLQEGGMMFGTVGKIIDGVEVKIEEEPGYRKGEGEILVKGPNVMLGYYKNPEETDKTLTNGWLHTGDIGMMVGNGFLKITDRKKEIFKTSGGKYIAPQSIENKLKESILIEQVMVCGESQKFPSALVVPSFVNLKEWCKLHEITYTTDEEMVKNERVVKKFYEEVEKVNASLAQFEKIKKIAILNKEWTINSNELTPSLKMKRRVITENYKTIIESLYID